MWSTNSLWFEIAVVSIVYAFGNILMGHFEERTPKLRRIAKYILGTGIVCLLSVYFGRTAAMVVLACFSIPLLYVHGYYLPKKQGINGWTGEPKARYYAFRKWDTNIFNSTEINAQKIIPLFKVSDMREALRHYTEVLDFVMTCPDDTPDSAVVDLGHEEMEFQITTHESDRLFGSVIYVYADDVNSLFAKYKSRGLNTDWPGSSVQQGPVNQTWGRREFYVRDADGNTLRYCQNIK